jgi:hypothetical protein
MFLPPQNTVLTFDSVVVSLLCTRRRGAQACVSPLPPLACHTNVTCLWHHLFFTRAGTVYAQTGRAAAATLKQKCQEVSTTKSAKKR